jgi:hypothetical protein
MWDEATLQLLAERHTGSGRVKNLYGEGGVWNRIPRPVLTSAELLESQGRTLMLPLRGGPLISCL